MFSTKTLIGAALTAAFCATTAHAGFIFTKVGDSLEVNYAKTVDSAALNASVIYTLLSLSNNTANFKIVATNNTLASATGDNRLTAFGIDMFMPSLTGVADTYGSWGTAINTNFPTFQEVAFCASAGKSCQGGGNGGLAEGGGSTTIKATMTFAESTAGGITFAEPFVVKFQSVGTRGNSAEFGGCKAGATSCVGNPPQEVPEPGSLALAGLALLGATALGRRRS